jgi:hypothetical protein
MRNELYSAIAEALRSMEEIGHVDLWNKNVEYIEQEAWSRPAVFIEIEPVTWSLTTGRYYLGLCRVRLHVVTDWSEEADSILAWNLSEKIQRALRDIKAQNITSLALQESHTNHNHEDIMESIEVYEVRGVRRMGE